MKLHYANDWTDDELQALLAAADQLPGNYATQCGARIGIAPRSRWWWSYIMAVHRGTSPQRRPSREAMKRDWRAIVTASGLDAGKQFVCQRRRSTKTSPAPAYRRGRVSVTLIAKVAALYASGMRKRDIPAAVGESANIVSRIRESHPEQWNKALEAAMRSSLDCVRKVAGTDAVLGIESYVERAEHLERWTCDANEPLFQQVESTGGYTLTTFFENYYLPVCMSEASPLSAGHYRSVLKKWSMLTGDPPLSKITNATLAKYRDALLAIRRHDKPLSVNTVRTQLQHLMILLNKAGPPGPRNRDAAGLIDPAPWVKLPKGMPREPRIVSDETLNRCYEAAGQMLAPELELPPVNWWRALLVVTVNLGLRSRSLFGLEWRDVDFESRTLIVRPEINKGRKKQVLPINDVVTAHLKAIRPKRADDGERVFRWPFSIEMFRRYLKDLQELAGVEPFGLHQLRKTCGTRLWASNPGAAVLMLGHSSIEITRQSYVGQVSVLRPVADAFPQPAAFTSTPASPDK